MTERFVNFTAQSLLNGAIDNAVTSISVDEVSLSPLLPNFRIRIDNEIMLVTAVVDAGASHTYTVTRGVESTTAASHLDNAIAYYVLTKGALEQALSEITTATIADSSNKRYVTDAQLAVLGNTSGTNTGDQTLVGLGGVPTSRTVNGHALSADVTVSKSDVSLGNADNTSDANKPVSTAQQTALNLKADLASPTFTGTVAGITKSMVGLGSVDNTADTAKPVSTAQQTALDLKANLASPTFTGTVAGITKSMVGLGSVDNVADLSKPVSSAQQAAIDAHIPRLGRIFMLMGA